MESQIKHDLILGIIQSEVFSSEEKATIIDKIKHSDKTGAVVAILKSFGIS